MRLLNTTTLTFEEFYDTEDVKYSILSHCWGQDKADPEVTLQAYLSGKYNVNGQGWQKILRCCALSKERDIGWTWIDTCCIDKSSSAELSEAINSMFRWYHESAVCFVFLDDCNVDSLPSVERCDSKGLWKYSLSDEDLSKISMFTECRWFTRGWTLQELLAPRSVLFFNSNHTCLGTRSELNQLISYASGIKPMYVVMGYKNMRKACAAERMSWARNRSTTRIEDVAYSLLGIFGVNMPLLHGEGRKAFQRLQHEIIRSSTDQSIFAWGINVAQTGPRSVLAESPKDFDETSATIFTNRSFTSAQKAQHIKKYTITNAGLSVEFEQPHLISYVKFRLPVLVDVTYSWVTLHLVRVGKPRGPGHIWARGMATTETDVNSPILPAGDLAGWLETSATRSIDVTMDDDIEYINKFSLLDYSTPPHQHAHSEFVLDRLRGTIAVALWRLAQSRHGFWWLLTFIGALSAICSAAGYFRFFEYVPVVEVYVSIKLIFSCGEWIRWLLAWLMEPVWG